MNSAEDVLVESDRKVFFGKNIKLNCEGGKIMPWGNGTGPAGLGPMTGRGAGYCAGYGVPGYMNPAGGAYGGRYGYGRGGGFGRGGWGYRNMYYATGVPGWARYGTYPYAGGYAPAAPYNPVDTEAAREAEEGYLKSQAELLRGNLNSLEKRLEELEKERENAKGDE